MHFYTESWNATNKSSLFDAKFFEFEEFSIEPFFVVASSLSTLWGECFGIFSRDWSLGEKTPESKLLLHLFSEKCDSKLHTLEPT